MSTNASYHKERKGVILPGWEYCYVQCVYPHILGAATKLEEVKPRYINGQEISNWKKREDAPAFINQMGEQGWELVSVYPEWLGGGSSSVYIRSFELVFKRSKA